VSRIVTFKQFEVDLRERELHRDGMKVRIQGQPFEVLAALLEKPGEVVTREELRGRLWPAHIFVDFEHSLNAAVKRLRNALGDSAAPPRFVETVARRGYRSLPLAGGRAGRGLLAWIDTHLSLHRRILLRVVLSSVFMIAGCGSSGCWARWLYLSSACSAPSGKLKPLAPRGDFTFPERTDCSRGGHRG